MHEFSFSMFIFFLVLACLLKFLGCYIGLNFVKISNISRINFAITMNARGGPGIVLASVAYYYQIINVSFFYNTYFNRFNFFDDGRLLVEISKKIKI